MTEPQNSLRVSSAVSSMWPPVTQLLIASQAHKQELQQQIAEKQAAADTLQAEHARLVGQHTMLARILDTQQSAVDILQGQQQVGPSLLPLVSSRIVLLPQQGTVRFSCKSSNAASTGEGRRD